jgi:aryl-alcohol dehydrogenase-like predicted oxidoreductase
MAERHASEEGSMLEKTTLGRSQIPVSRLGLAGGYGIDADGVVRAFHELGVNYFFVTPRFTPLVEGLRRLIADGHRKDLVLAMGAKYPVGWSVPREFDAATKALGTDTIDVFHLFWVQAHWYVTGNTWPAMQKLKDEGKVRALAVSCHDRPMARALVDELSLDALMIRYNAAHRGAEKEIFATLPTPRPGIIAYTATRWGKLLKPAKGLGAMSGPECYRFAIGHPSVDTVLCGAGSYEELAANAAGVMQGPLPAARLDEVKRFGDAVRATATGSLGFLGA